MKDNILKLLIGIPTVFITLYLGYIIFELPIIFGLIIIPSLGYYIGGELLKEIREGNR